MKALPILLCLCALLIACDRQVIHIQDTIPANTRFRVDSVSDKYVFITWEDDKVKGAVLHEKSKFWLELKKEKNTGREFRNPAGTEVLERMD